LPETADNESTVGRREVLSEIKVIINADDLGMSRNVNDATFELMGNGQVTSATMLANSPFIEEACERASKFPECSFGAHLNLTEFTPLTGPRDLDSILDADGAFILRRILEIPIDSSLANRAFEESCAQIEKLQSLGISVDHLDSHHHIHTLPRLFRVLKKIQKKYQIRRVRISRNIYAGDESVRKTLLLKKHLYNFALRHYYRTRTTQGFTDFKGFMEHCTKGRLKYRTVELMVHPGSDLYENDYEQLAKPWRERLKFPVSLINYREI
jgi:predicted glycoside hydrolase/deacetylase ChbG (UPF0249 family)